MRPSLLTHFKTLAKRWKLLNVRKFFFLPHILNSQEKRLFLLLIAIIIASGFGIFFRLYLKITTPVPDVGKTYTEGSLREPRVINPIFATQDIERDLSGLIFSRLLAYSGNGEIKPDLAEELKVSEVGKTYTIILRKEIKWHDGEPLSADDVIFTIQTIQNPQYKSPLRANWQGVTVEKLDSYTIRLTLRTPYAPFIENLALGIIPKHLWKDISPEQITLHELALKPIGSGPYVFKRFTQDKDGSLTSYEVKRNAVYHQEGPYLKTIRFIFFKEEESLIAAWRKGKIDSFGPILEKHLPDLASGKVNILSIRMPRIFGIFFNEQHAPILASKAVREAIARAIDKKEIAKQTVSGGAVPHDFPLPPLTVKTGNDAVLNYPYDPDKSRRILEENGWKDEDGDGIREKKITSGKKTALTPLRLTLATSDWLDLLTAAEHLKTMLKEAGIEIIVEIHSFNELEASIIRPRNFDMLLFGEVYGYEPDPFPFWHSSQIKDPGLNVALYINKKADQLLEEARRSSDPNTRNIKYEEFQKIISQDIPVVFLYSQLYRYLMPADIKGADISKISLPADRFNEINKWYRDTKRIFKK